MLTYLEAARYKISCALAELDGKSKPSHPLATHIHVIRDRQGFQQSILKVIPPFLTILSISNSSKFFQHVVYIFQVPPWVQKDTSEQPEQVESPDWTDRGTADGNSVQPDSDFGTISQKNYILPYESSYNFMREKNTS